MQVINSKLNACKKRETETRNMTKLNNNKSKKKKRKKKKKKSRGIRVVCVIKTLASINSII